MTNKQYRYSVQSDQSPLAALWLAEDPELLHADVDVQADLSHPWVHIVIYRFLFELPHNKTNKLSCAPSKDSDQHGHSPSLIRVFAVRMKKAWVLSYPLSTQWRLIRLGGCPGWSESSLGAYTILLVLTWGGSYVIMRWLLISWSWFEPGHEKTCLRGLRQVRLKPTCSATGDS